jgi:hypothetical protein
VRIPHNSRRFALRLSVPVLFMLLAGIGGRPPSATAETEAQPPPEVAVEAPSVREDRLLHLLCRYLKLTRAQILHLAPFARQTSRGRDLLERECAERRRVFEPLAVSQPEASERLRLAMEQRREAVLADLTATGSRALVRILTREQIALAWRLSQRNPPKYALADPALLEPQSGFVNQAAQLLLRDVGQSDEFVLSQPDAVVGRVLELELVPRNYRALRLPLTGNSLLEQDGYEHIGPRGFRIVGTESRPFPQLVAETNDPNDLLPALTPLAERVFFSDRWLPVLEEVLRTGENPAAGTRRAATAPLRLLRDFRMERGFRDLTGKGPELEPLGGDVEHGQYLFEAGQGLRIPDAGVTDHYAIQLNLLYHGGDSYQKIIDFKNRASDGGLYFYQGHLTFYTLANGGAPQPEQEHRLRLERDRNTRIVRGYLDLRPIFAFIDLDDDAVFEKGAGSLFVDDLSTKNEQGPGAFRSLNVWGPAAAP